MTRYDDEFRSSAVLMLEAAGYPDKKGALTRVAKALKMQPRTLSRWFNGEQNPPPDQAVSRKKVDLVDALRGELAAIFSELGDARQDASYRDMATAAGIFFDKLQLLTDKPTERIENRVSGELTIEERVNRVNSLLDSARARRTGQPDTGSGDDQSYTH